MIRIILGLLLMGYALLASFVGCLYAVGLADLELPEGTRDWPRALYSLMTISVHLLLFGLPGVLLFRWGKRALANPSTDAKAVSGRSATRGSDMGMFDWLLGKKQSKPEPIKTAPRNAAKTESSDPWDRAIALAESGRRAEAVAEFRRAIDRNPKYYISDIVPRSAQAAACWKEAVDQYVREKEAKAGTNKGTETRCAQCGKDIGIHWHYDFESISYARSVASQCPDCGRILCSNDVAFGPDRNYAPCPHCGVSPVPLFEGPAVSSCVEQGQAQRRYVGAIRPPSTLGRDVKRG